MPKIITISRSDIERTYRVTWGVTPCRASVVLICCSGSSIDAAVSFSFGYAANARRHGAVPWNRYSAGTVALSKNRAWAIAAFTVER